MPANEQSAIRLAAKRGPKIAGGVGVRFDWQCLKLFSEPRASGDPRRSESDALRAIIIASEGAQFLEFGDGMLRIYRVHVGIMDKTMSFPTKQKSSSIFGKIGIANCNHW